MGVAIRLQRIAQENGRDESGKIVSLDDVEKLRGGRSDSARTPSVGSCRSLLNLFKPSSSPSVLFKFRFVVIQVSCLVSFSHHPSLHVVGRG
jgi:hypothetical protein